MKRASLLTLTLIGAFSAIQAAWAVDYPLPPTGSRLVGQNQTYTVQEGDKNLQAIARRFDTAAMLILEANNTIAPVPKPGTTITIPSQLLLPDAPRQGIIVNLAELRLYYYPPGENIPNAPNVSVICSATSYALKQGFERLCGLILLLQTIHGTSPALRILRG